MSDLTIPADHTALRRLRSWLDTHAPHLDPSEIGRIELCVHELATNVIDHAGATELSLRAESTASSLQIQLRDGGVPLATPISPSSDQHPRIRGYGLMIAEQLASELSYERCDAINVWSVRFDLS